MALLSIRISRRTMFKRALAGMGVLVAGIAALAIVDADRSELGKPLYQRTLGDGGPRLVFLPGIGATTRYWEWVVGSLATRMRLVLVDLLGFGRSPKPWTTYSVERHVNELHGVLGPLAAQGQLTLIGHSLGARLAVAYAARHPAQVERLVLVSMPYFGGGEKAMEFMRARESGGW